MTDLSGEGPDARPEFETGSVRFKFEWEVVDKTPPTAYEALFGWARKAATDIVVTAILDELIALDMDVPDSEVPYIDEQAVQEYVTQYRMAVEVLHEVVADFLRVEELRQGTLHLLLSISADDIKNALTIAAEIAAILTGGRTIIPKLGGQVMRRLKRWMRKSERVPAAPPPDVHIYGGVTITVDGTVINFPEPPDAERARSARETAEYWRQNLVVRRAQS